YDGVEPRDDVRGSILRRKYAIPSAGFIPGHEFAYGRHIRQRRRTHGGRDREATKRSRLDVLDRWRQRLEQDLHLPAEQVCDRRRRAAVGDMDEIGPGHDLEKLAGEVLRRPAPG